MLCLWEWGTLPRLGSVHPPMGGSELSPSPSLNVSPLCKGLPGQVGLPGEIGVPGPKVRGGGSAPSPSVCLSEAPGTNGGNPIVCVGIPYSRHGLCSCSQVPLRCPPSHGQGMPPFPV